MKTIGIILFILGLLILLYKDAGFYGFGGYVDKSPENLIISFSLLIVGYFLTKRKS